MLLRSAELVDLARRAVVRERALDRCDDVPDPDRREARARPRERQAERNRAQEPREAVHEVVARPEDHGRLEDRPGEVRAAFLAHDALAAALAPEVVARAGVRVRIERAHVQEPVDPLAPAGIDELSHEVHVRARESAAAAAALVQDADQVDHRLLAGAERGELRRDRAHSPRPA